MLNSILNPSEKQRISHVEITNPIKERDFADDKLAIMDLVARASDGRLFTIEIQVANEPEMQKRALYYWSNIFVSQARMGMEYEELKKTISINILDYRLWPQTEKYHTVFQPLEETEGFLLSDAAEIRFIELPKMHQKWKAGEFKGSRDPLVKWFLLLMAAEDEQIAEELEVIAMTDGIIKKAVSEWDRLSQDQDTRAIYRSRMMARMDQASAMKAAERKAKAEGKMEGKMETAKMALQAGVSLEMIAQITGLDQSTILKLKDE